MSPEFAQEPAEPRVLDFDAGRAPDRSRQRALIVMRSGDDGQIGTIDAKFADCAGRSRCHVTIAKKRKHKRMRHALYYIRFQLTVFGITF